MTPFLKNFSFPGGFGHRWFWVMPLLLLVIGSAITAAVVYNEYLYLKEAQVVNAERYLNEKTEKLDYHLQKRMLLVDALEAFVHSQLRNGDFFQSWHQISQDEFERFANMLERQVNGVLSLQLSPDVKVTFVSNPQRNKAAIGLDLLADPRNRHQVMKTLNADQQLTLGPLNLVQGGRALISRKAVYGQPEIQQRQRLLDGSRVSANDIWLQQIPDNLWGLVTVLVDFDVLLREAGLHEQGGQFQMAIRPLKLAANDFQVIWGNSETFDHPLALDTYRFPGGAWLIAVKPREALSLDDMIWVGSIGLGVTLLLVLSWVFSQVASSAAARNRAKTDFLANMSHEIRTPMNGVIGILELALEGACSAKQRQLIEHALSSSEITLRILNDLLDFSRIEQGGLSIHADTVELSTVFRDVIRPFLTMAESKNLRFTSAYQSCRDVWVKTDEVRLRQILSNLLSNAVKFTQSGYVDLTISCQQQDTMIGLQMDVIDSGEGIDKVFLPKLFERFSQADRVGVRHYEGSGLGMAITHELVKLMGGEISVVSELGKGSHFTVTLTLERADLLMEVSPPGSLSPLALDNIKGFKILLVEDNVMNQVVVKELLEGVGVELSIMTDGRSACENVIKNPEAYDLILMDLQMPIMDGITATQSIRKHFTDEQLPIIGLSANVMQETIHEATAAGMNDFITKPVRKEQLLRVLCRFRDN